MKICLIAPPLFKVSPDAVGGGLETVVVNLAEALAEKGHDVTLVAADGSSAKGVKIFEVGPAPGRTGLDWAKLESDAFRKYEPILKDFDVISDHTWFFFCALAKKDDPALKMTHTHHGHCDSSFAAVPDWVKPMNFIAISQFMADEYKRQGFEAKVAYNGIDLADYPYWASKSNRFIFVGRIMSIKGVELAIRAALMAKRPIDVVGTTNFIDDDPSFVEQIRGMCAASGGLAVLHENISHQAKLSMLQKAKACLIPSAFGEPFGLTAIEAMACGTPVITLDDGALREVILGDVRDDPYEGRKRGAVCQTEAQFINAVLTFDTHGTPVPEVCRARAERFSREQMADRYLELYQEVIAGNGW
jgi:glycosyltransferase involved in cell wall biosynthesis